jgi:alkanesulfonate monooxygenase SsuD/methylene tetrahydromethanopterin reductase-like flavin-dependent oxidoreductase (luciferase family)
MRDIWDRTNPKPVRNPIPLLMGGKGAKRTLPLVAREAMEWNLSRLDAEMFRERRAVLEQCCRDIGRDPGTIRRSVMTSYIVGRNQAELRERAAQVSQLIPDLRALTPDEVLEHRKSAWFVGTPEQIAGRMREFAALGVDIFMLQHFLLDDSDALRTLAEEVIPAVA